MFKQLFTKPQVTTKLFKPVSGINFFYSKLAKEEKDLDKKQRILSDAMSCDAEFTAPEDAINKGFAFLAFNKKLFELDAYDCFLLAEEQIEDFPNAEKESYQKYIDRGKEQVNGKPEIDDGALFALKLK